MNRHVRAALEQGKLEHHAEEVHGRIMRWLETDGSWADMYSVTGELSIGQVQQSSDEVDDAVKLVAEVGCVATPALLPLIPGPFRACVRIVARTVAMTAAGGRWSFPSICLS